MGMIKLLFSFQGRINRSQYWLGGLVIFAVLLIAIVGAVGHVAGAFGKDKHDIGPSILPLVLLMVALYLICAWSGAALNVKRLHDRGRTGFIALLALVPGYMMISGLMSSGGDLGHLIGAGVMTNLVGSIINIFFLVDLGMLPGKPEPNQYGDPPRPGDYSGPRPVRPAAGPAALNGAQQAMERAISGQSSPRSAPQPQAVTAPAPRPAIRAQPAPEPGARAFGKRSL